jgi:hypothetical protein
VYWASVSDSKEAAANTLERIRRYREALKDSGRAARMRRGFNTFYGRAPDGSGDTSRTSSSGDQGEYVDVTLNNFATLVTQSVVRTTANKPAFKAIATNADSASMMQASFGQGLLEYYTNTYSLADRDWEMVEIGAVCHEGWEVFGWDSTKGKNLTDFSDEEAVKEGDIEAHATTPFRVAYDPDAESVDALEWFAYKRRFNRFVLAANAKDEETRQKLLQVRDVAHWNDTDDDLSLDVQETKSTDLIWVWELRHLPTDALPRGRLLRFVDAECVLLDSMNAGTPEQPHDVGYPYDELHAYRYCPATVIGNIAGHAPSSDLLGLQELKDTVATQAATAANAGGITNMWSQLGDKPVVSSITGSMNFIQSKTKPEILEGPELSAQIPPFDAMLTENMQARMGESDVSMGNVPKGMPGNLAALLEAKTVQYNSRGQASYAHVLERSRTGLLKMLKKFAKSPRVAVLGGISEGYEFKEWSAEDLSGVDRFVVEAVNPLTQTYSGKMDAAKELLDHQLITDPKQYLLLRETGRLEPLLESETATRMGVRKEKEMLLKGIGLAPVDPAASFEAAAANPGMPPAPVFVDDGQPHIRPLIYDKHWLHITEDLGAIAMPQARDDGKIAEAVMGVVEERKRLLKLMDPVMLAILGCPPEIAQAIMMSQMPPPMPGQESGTPPPKPGETDTTKAPEVGGLPNGAPRISAPKPAKPPPDPITGVQAPSPVEA